MKDTTLQKPIIEWQEISLHDFLNVEIEFKPAKIIYNAFFYIFWLAGKIIVAFKDVFISDPTIEKNETITVGAKIERELISLFDKAYSLDDKA